MKLFIPAFLFLLSFKSFSQTLEDDRLALVALHQSVNGVGYNGVKWVVPGTPGDNPCGWGGIGCEAGRVTSLAIPGIKLKGEIPAEIGNLTALKTLVMTGTSGGVPYPPSTIGLPIDFGKLVNLEELYLQHNNLSSKNIEVLGKLINLKLLSITQLWPLPEEIGSLAKLENLTILGDGSVLPKPLGPLPSSFVNLTSLKSLTIENVGITGQLPSDIGNLINLNYLSIVGTLMEGSIPASIGNLTGLGQLYIGGMTNAGSIPPEIGKLTKLIRLGLNNGHTGTIPKEINNLVKASGIYLNGNFLKGPIPDLSALMSKRINIVGNSFNFDGIEGHTDRYYQYSDQREIPLRKDNGAFYVDAGGTLSKNTFKWYLNDILQATIVGNDKFTPTVAGRYHVEVTNSDATGLTLISEGLGGSLPVNLISFSGESDYAGNRLIWQTGSEINNKGFEIEKSPDARTFEKVGFVEGDGDSKELNNYQFVDHDPYGITYYRLKQLDYDGKYEYSKVIMIRNMRELKVYPNPSKDYIIVSGLNKEEDLLVTNQSGKVVLKQTIKAASPINIQTLPTGFYTLNIGGLIKKIAVLK